MVKTKSIVGSLISNELKAHLPTLCKAGLNAVSRAQKVFPKSDFVRGMFHKYRNWYEGGWPLWTGGAESYLPSLVQDARWDQNYVTRREMLRRMRYWSQNSPLVEAILSVGERYTVGPSGLHVSFYSADDMVDNNQEYKEDPWYEAAETVVREWFGLCGWNNESMEQLLKIGYRDQKVDGEIFFLKTRKVLPLKIGNRTLMVNKPCLQIIEAHRVESPWNRFEQSERTLIDGVQYETVKNNGIDMLQPVGFWCRTGSSSFEQNDSWQLIKCEDIWQLRNVHRADQPRSVSDFYACEVMINKHEDTLEIEMKAHSAHAVRAVAVESASGQAASPTDRKLEFINAARGVAAAPPGNADWTARQEVFRRETGAYVYGIKTGEKIHFDSPTRPSESTLNLLEYQVNAIVSACHAPRCLVFEKISGASARGQGTEVRAQLDAADHFYKGDFQKWKHFIKQAVVWYMEWAVKNDPRVSDPPANWRDCLHVQQPEACNVDVGYNTQAQLMQLAAGAMDYDMILGPQGLSFVTVAKRLARQQKMLEKMKVKVTLPALLPGQIPLDAPAKEETANV
jgi:hypothetical protein